MIRQKISGKAIQGAEMRFCVDLYDSDKLIESIAVAIPALSLMMSPEERSDFRRFIQSISARYELRHPSIAQFLNAVISDTDAIGARLEIGKGGNNEQGRDHTQDS